MGDVNKKTKRWSEGRRVWEIYTKEEKEREEKLEKDHVNKTLTELEEERQISRGKRLVGQQSEWNLRIEQVI